MIIHSLKAAFILSLVASCTVPAVKSAQNSFSSCQSKESLLFDAVKKDNVDILRSLLEDEANIDGEDGRGNNLLHLAAHHGNLEIVTFLVLEKNMDIHSKDSDGYTP